MRSLDDFLTQLAGLAGATAIRAWMSTLEYKAAFYDPAVDPARPECRGRKIYLFWHEYILFPIYLRGHNNLTMLLSRHRDAQVLAAAAHHLGFECVRGSTYGGSRSALLELARKSRDMNLTITPDGPRGPRRRLAQGPVWLASKLGLPLVLLGLGYERPWRLGSWDRFAIPRPYSRARGVIGPALAIPPHLDRDGIESYRRRVERLLNRLTVEAEAWADSGTRKLGELPVRREPMPLATRRFDAAHAPGGPHGALLAGTEPAGRSRPSTAAEFDG